ncbi:hypothetical protein [Cerasicoccus fimbriatus]|uniref:hypothetical protein n=1 Tax=Cerasicoccus fimbriatus TaxID=3014554 RepID=UPI0022B31E3B|nr:hypothetical protein [Cerasicoccus sp. TK19100]
MNDADAQLLMRFYDAECTPAEEDAAGELIRSNPTAADWLAELAAQQERWETLPPVLNEVAIEADWQALRLKLANEGAQFKGRAKRELAWSSYWTAGAAAVVFLLASITVLLPRHELPTTGVTPNIVESVETDIEGATPIIFVDQQSGWSVVWVDEPARS